MTGTILAIDSSVGISSCALWRGGKLAVSLEDRESSMQSARLMPLIEQALKEAKISYKDLSLVASTVGPGSFTGIRIGLAAARGIAFAQGVPCAGYTTLEVMHAGGADLCILNAGKGEVFFQHFGTSKTEPAIGKLDDILARFPGASIASSVALPEGYDTPKVTFPSAALLARLAAEKPVLAVNPMPFYIRPPDAKPSATLPHAVEGS